jgi:hypothetical protein
MLPNLKIELACKVWKPYTFLSLHLSQKNVSPFAEIIFSESTSITFFIEWLDIDVLEKNFNGEWKLIRIWRSRLLNLIFLKS